MDDLKRATSKEYTIWDMNCPKVYKPPDKSKMAKKFKRKARRNFKQTLDKQRKMCYNDINEREVIDNDN